MIGLSCFTLVLAGMPQQFRVTEAPCKVVNASESQDEFKQHWKVHCVGTTALPPLFGLSVTGELVCLARNCVFGRTPTKVEGIHGHARVIEVTFSGACQWCPVWYIETSPPPASAICRCCSGYWPCKDGDIAPFPAEVVRTSLYPPELSVQGTYSVPRDNYVLIEIVAYDRDGDLLAVYWSNPSPVVCSDHAPPLLGQATSLLSVCGTVQLRAGQVETISG